MEIPAVVFKKDGKPKEGRGFSKEELRKAALDFKKALKLGIAVDSKRRTLHEENVKALKEYVGSLKKAETRKKREA
ncbi:MAG TPA: ribosomal protein L13e [Candidatus Bathyarchaeia archaeon]|nr:ribosomal protein L13e [Candidatus Bathyarchaeia archaeon]